MKPIVEQPHIPALDGLRGVAIILVVLNHGINIPIAYYSGIDSFLANLAASCGYGVQLFFVLSGFLITGILLDSRTRAGYFTNFYARRILRIFPLYYGTLLAFAIAAWFHGFSGDALFFHRLPWLLAYLSNILITYRHDWSFVFGYHSLGHFWSLAVEEQFYLIWPAVVLWLSSRHLKFVCLGAIVIGYISRVFLLYPAHNLLGTIVFLPCQVDALSIGALLAVLVRERERLVASAALPVVIVCGAVWLVTCMDMMLLLTAGMTAFSFMSAGLLGLALYSRGGSIVLRTWVLRQFGKYSYAIYVLHVIILPFIRPLKAELGTPLFVMFFAAISFVAGWLSWYLYEVHFLRLKRFFPTGSAVPWRPRSRPELFAPAASKGSTL